MAFSYDFEIHVAAITQRVADCRASYDAAMRTVVLISHSRSVD